MAEGEESSPLVPAKLQSSVELDVRAWGLALALATVLSSSPDSALLKAANGITEDVAVVAFWRSVFAGHFQIAVEIFTTPSVGVLWKRTFVISPKSFASIVIFYFMATIAYTLNFTFVDTAMGYVIFSTNTLLVVLFSWVVFREFPSLGTWITLGVCTIAVIVSTLPLVMQTRQGRQQHSDDRASARGVLFAAASAVTFAMVVVCYRYVKTKHPRIAVNAAVGVSNFAVALAWLSAWATRSEPSSMLPSSGRFWLLVLIDAACIAAYQSLMQASLKHITGPEFILIFSVGDSVLAPVWAYLLDDDVPSLWTVGGGIVVMIALACWTNGLDKLQWSDSLKTEEEAGEKEGVLEDATLSGSSQNHQRRLDSRVCIRLRRDWGWSDQDPRSC